MRRWAEPDVLVFDGSPLRPTPVLITLGRQGAERVCVLQVQPGRACEPCAARFSAAARRHTSDSRPSSAPAVLARRLLASGVTGWAVSLAEDGRRMRGRSRSLRPQGAGSNCRQFVVVRGRNPGRSRTESWCPSGRHLPSPSGEPPEAGGARGGRAPLALGRRICAAVSGLSILFPMGILIRLRREGVLCAERPSPFGNRVMGRAGACQEGNASPAPPHCQWGMGFSRLRPAA